jgi:polar amino acid transport system permease protein
MGVSGTISTLLGWTPFLAGGFVFNLLIAALSMLFGTILGGALGRARSVRSWMVRVSAASATGLCRNVPSFVLMFYVAFVLPVEIAWAGTIVAVPMWIKATLALTIPVTGFTSDQMLAFRRQSRAGVGSAGSTFMTAWLQYFLIVLMASATASVIGADEIVGRANRVIATDQRPEFLIATYVYVSAWFLLTGLFITAAAARLARARRRAANGRTRRDLNPGRIQSEA